MALSFTTSMFSLIGWLISHRNQALIITTPLDQIRCVLVLIKDRVHVVWGIKVIKSHEHWCISRYTATSSWFHASLHSLINTNYVWALSRASLGTTFPFYPMAKQLAPCDLPSNDYSSAMVQGILMSDQPSTIFSFNLNDISLSTSNSLPNNWKLQAKNEHFSSL